VRYSFVQRTVRTNVARNDLQRGAEKFVMRRGGLMKLVTEFYPNHKWDKSKFLGRQKKSSQWWLYKTLVEIFPPGIGIMEDYQFPDMSCIQKGHLMIFDVYVPLLNIIFEYLGYHHYHNSYMFGDVKSHKELDKKETRNLHSSQYLLF